MPPARFAMHGEKRGQMTSDASILRVGESHLSQAGAAGRFRQFCDRDFRDKAVRQNAREFLAIQLRFDRSANQRRTPAWNRNRRLLQSGVVK